VPSLSKLQLDSALERLKALPVDNVSKRAIEDTLRAASNPNAERIDVVIKSLEPERRKMIEKTAKGLRDLSAEVNARGKERLEAISDEQWQRLLDDEIN
jgi:hypothetical protein